MITEEVYADELDKLIDAGITATDGLTEEQTQRVTSYAALFGALAIKKAAMTQWRMGRHSLAAEILVGATKALEEEAA